MAPPRLRVDGRVFRDNLGREVTIHGINAAADAKLPFKPNVPSHVSEYFFDGDNVSFVERPFSTKEAHEHFARLKRWGYNTIRYVFTWEAIEAAGPGKYDEDWIQHQISILRIAKDYGLYIFMDPHQDVWSRYSAGSGAPMWTLYAAGLNPRNFAITEAAVVQNTWPEPKTFPKMIWGTNYTRLACQTMFTLFFAGKTFAPKAIIDGVNIQDYLQSHFLNALRHLALRIHEAGDLENEVVVGWESVNEPHRGLIGWKDISVFPSETKLQKGTCPTAWQAMLTGSGRAVEIDTWDFGGMGPYKSGSTLVDPAGQSAWLPTDYDDSKYGWKRDPGWKLGECLWAQHGIWDPSTDTLLRKDYFAKHPKTGENIDYEFFTNHWFMDYYRKHSAMVKEIFPESIMFCQPPVLEIPPSIKDTADDDPNLVFAPHYYDGITLLTKKWNRLWNIDVFGVLRGKYLAPAFAIKIGETAIRNCLRDQLSAIRAEGVQYMGDHPCVFTEIGIPYDMDDSHAYKTGDYSSQISAMDANHFAIEGSQASGYTLWTYVAINNHRWGDQWNGEDLSIYSNDDTVLGSASSLAPNSPSFSQGASAQNVSPANLKQALSTESMNSQATKDPSDGPDKAGYRAVEAFLRPTPIATHGNVTDYGFDLKYCTFTLSLTAPSSTAENTPTEIFLPAFHFPQSESSVEVTGGKWAISIDDDEVGVQRLRWWHAAGEQKITIKGVKRKAGAAVGADEEDGYFEQYAQMAKSCAVM